MRLSAARPECNERNGACTATTASGSIGSGTTCAAVTGPEDDTARIGPIGRLHGSVSAKRVPASEDVHVMHACAHAPRRAADYIHNFAPRHSQTEGVECGTPRSERHSLLQRAARTWPIDPVPELQRAAH